MNNTELREMLEFAALAAGHKVVNPNVQDFYAGFTGIAVETIHAGQVINVVWRPHADDGDSRRLQVALGIDLIMSSHENSIQWIARKQVGYGRWLQYLGPDPKRAVLRVAAEIGRRLKAEREGVK